MAATFLTISSFTMIFLLGFINYVIFKRKEKFIYYGFTTGSLTMDIFVSTIFPKSDRLPNLEMRHFLITNNGWHLLAFNNFRFLEPQGPY